MKTKFAIAAIALALSSASAFASLENLANGSVTFNGEVKSASCNVNVLNQGGDATVVLPTIDKSDLSDTAPVALTEFKLEVTNCDFDQRANTKQFALAWTGGETSDAGKGFLVNLADEDVAAQNVYLAVFNPNRFTNNYAIVPDGTGDAKSYQNYTKNGATFTYNVGYVTNDRSAATAGQVVAKTTYTLSYE